MACTFTPLRLPGLVLIEPKIHHDDRGSFAEVYKQSEFEAYGIGPFVQENESLSHCGVLRGLHYQTGPHAQGKLVRCITGAIYDVAVDIRLESKTYGQYVGILLSSRNRALLWIPPGFAHGFLALGGHNARVVYKVTAEYDPRCEYSVRWDDPAININWPLRHRKRIISAKDAAAPLLANASIGF